MYEPDDVGHSLVILDDVPPELEQKARLGVENCPEQAITIVERTRATGSVPERETGSVPGRETGS